MKQFNFSIYKVVWILFVFGIYSKSNFSWSAACCARSPATPTLIVGDDQAQFNIGVAFSRVVAEPWDDGSPVWLDSNRSEVSRNFRLDGAILISDRVQVGAGLAFINRHNSIEGESSSSVGIGDLRLSAGYEFLPSWSYSLWKPQGFLFSVLTIPTGRSLHQAQSPTLSDVTGNGFYSTSVGSLLIKRWNVFDTFFVSEVHYSFPRSFEAPGESFRIIPGIGGSVTIGGGFSPYAGRLRLGLRIQPRIDQAKKVETSSLNQNSNGWESNTDVGADLSYLIGSTSTLMLSYIDQTLLGPASNSNLNRTIGINFQHRWAR